jgi:hypothetical protein
MLDLLFALVPVPNDLAPKQHEQIIGYFFHLCGGIFVNTLIGIAVILRRGRCIFKHYVAIFTLTSKEIALNTNVQAYLVF